MNISQIYDKTQKLIRPPWASYFKHYNQMDQASFHLADFIFEHQDQLKGLKFSCVELYCPQTSYFSDVSFVQDEKLKNPSKFIYTLPSVRSNVLCGILSWEGPVYCFVEKFKQPKKNVLGIECLETETSFKVSCSCLEGVSS